MRILHICQRDDPDTGGSLRVAESLVREQRTAGLDVWLLFLYGAPASVSKSLAGRTICLHLSSSKQALRGIKRLHKVIRQVAPDVIHSHDGITWPRLVFMLFRIPVVTHLHLPVETSLKMKDKVGGFLIKKTTDILIGISLHTIDTWVRSGYPPSRIHYVPNGVDFDRFRIVDKVEKQLLREQLGLPVDKHILLWVGRLHRTVKGSDRVERIAKLLPPNMVLVVVGNGPEFSGMVQRCKGMVAAGKIVLVGSTVAPEGYYESADSFLFTSHREAFGLVILEAASCGLPIFSFPVNEGGGAAELLSELNATMLYDEASDASLRAILEDNASCEPRLSSRQLAIFKYSSPAVSKKVVDVYKLALNKTR